MKLKDYLQDGACAQARAVMAMIQDRGSIEKSWCEEYNVYKAQLNIGRWENCREQGYVVSVNAGGKQLNIAFFEHRNSDGLCAVKWEQCSTNTIGIDNAKFSDVYKNKWDVSKSVSFGQIMEMAEWILAEFEGFYDNRVGSKRAKVEKAI